MFEIATSQYRYSGPGRLDITVKGADGIGKIYAPTWDMVKGFKEGTLSQEDYIVKYRKLMRNRFKTDVLTWTSIIKDNNLVVLVCFCPAENFCHRHILAEYLTLTAKSMGYRVNNIGEIK